MKSWSQDCLGRMKAVLFLDTNILSYLVDNTYPQLNQLISNFKDTCVVNLISSEYCQLEFVGIRKREHYLREVIKNATNNGKIVNCSSLLKNHNQFDCREVQFETILPSVRNAVNEDINHIVSEYGIEFCCKIHEDLFLPISEICLHSKISKEDSFVIVSAVNPLPSQYNYVCFVLTHDKDFEKWHRQAMADLSAIYQGHHLPEPIMVHQTDTFGFNLDKNKPFDFDIVKAKFMKEFIDKNCQFYLGKTMVPSGNNAPVNMFALQSSTTNKILANKYITIVGKNLDYSITTPTPIQFFHKNNPVANGTIYGKGVENIITGLFCQEDTVNEKVFSDKDYNELLSLIQTEGNYVFYHPDSLLMS